jgi:hypothetical protein
LLGQEVERAKFVAVPLFDEDSIADPFLGKAAAVRYLTGSAPQPTQVMDGVIEVRATRLEADRVPPRHNGYSIRQLLEKVSARPWLHGLVHSTRDHLC